jgi:signal transduction histidine kinase
MTTTAPLPITRRNRVFDIAIGVVVFVIAVLLIEGAEPDSLVLRSPAEVPLLAWPVFVIAAVTVVFRRTRPIPVFIIAMTCGFISGVAGWSDLIGLTFLVGLYSVARYSDSTPWVAASLVLAAIFAISTLLIDEESALSTAVFGVAVMGVTWYAGRRVRDRSERKAKAEQERIAEVRRMVTEERARIARELHDVVAHRVSLMTVQAGAAKTVAGTDLEAAVQAMQAVETAGREALDELRHLLDVLRPEAEGAALSPQPGVADLPRLVAQFGKAGTPVALELSDLPENLPARVDLFAYRIVQESLTNVLKHAGTEPSPSVTVAGNGDRLRIEVTDHGRGATILPGSGHGIVGMRERALLLGGSFDAGPTSGGGWRVVATLPTGGNA